MHKTIFIIAALLLSCNSSNTSVNENVKTATEQRSPVASDPLTEVEDSTTNITYEWVTVFDENVGWGYRILQNGEPYINQPHIPAISGMKGFDSELDASNTALLMIYKLEHGIVPPSVSVEELDSIGVSY